MSLLDADGRPVKVIYRYARYHVEGEDECDDLDEALGRAYYDAEYNEAMPLAILIGGVVKYDREAILAENSARAERDFERRTPAREKPQALPNAGLDELTREAQDMGLYDE